MPAALKDAPAAAEWGEALAQSLPFRKDFRFRDEETEEGSGKGHS